MAVMMTLFSILKIILVVIMIRRMEYIVPNFRKL